MQPEEYLLFFQQLFQHYYLFTLDNPVYAICLAVSVWLLTAIFYSIRIGILNRRNHLLVKIRLDLQNTLNEAEQSFQQMESELAEKDERLAQESQACAALQERIQEVGNQLSAAIVAVAADADLGQQGLSVAPGLQIEDLWLRFHAATRQLIETVKQERNARALVQQAYDAEADKMAAMNQQLQILQTRLDEQKQQYVGLEAAFAQEKAVINAELIDARQQLAVSRASQLADKSRLSTLEAQMLNLKQDNPQPVESVKVSETPVLPIIEPPVAQPVLEVQIEPFETIAIQPEIPEIIETPLAVNETAVAAAPETATGKMGGGMFARLKQRIDSLDKALGQNTPQAMPEQQDEPVRQPVVVAEPVAPMVEASAKKDDSLTAKLQGLFGKKTVVDQPVVDEPQEMVVVEPAVAAHTKNLAGQVKSLLGRFSRQT